MLKRFCKISEILQYMLKRFCNNDTISAMDKLNTACNTHVQRSHKKST
jgi:hypothetical protein